MSRPCLFFAILTLAVPAALVADDGPLGSYFLSDQDQSRQESTAKVRPASIRTVRPASIETIQPDEAVVPEPLEPAPYLEPSPEVYGPWWDWHHARTRDSVYAVADGLVWWIKGQQAGPLVTTSPLGTPRADAGVLGLPNTQVVHGGRLDENHRYGGRIRLGYWLSDCGAFEASYFSVGDGANSGNFYARSTGNPILARPFFDTVADAQASQLVAYPGFVDGSIQTLTHSELHSGSLTLRHSLLASQCSRVDLLAGYRYFRFRENLTIGEALISRDIATGVPSGTTIDVWDEFTVENDFHGAELGMSAQWDFQRVTLDAEAKLAVGNVYQRMRVFGKTTVTAAGGNPATAPGGVYALPTNIGRFTRNDFGLLPEVAVNLQYRLTTAIRVQAGYTLLYLTDALRSGDQIDRVINTNQLPIGGGGPIGVNRPAPLMHDTALWAMGANFGLVLEY